MIVIKKKQWNENQSYNPNLFQIWISTTYKHPDISTVEENKEWSALLTTQHGIFKMFSLFNMMLVTRIRGNLIYALVSVCMCGYLYLHMGFSLQYDIPWIYNTIFISEIGSRQTVSSTMSKRLDLLFPRVAELQWRLKNFWAWLATWVGVFDGTKFLDICRHSPFPNLCRPRRNCWCSSCVHGTPANQNPIIITANIGR